MTLTAHIINHTHWDREWFASYKYTREWIPKLIAGLGKLVKENKHYKFFLDGQTLVLNDLEKIDPKSYQKAKTLIRQGNLIIGPYFAQLDWKIPSGESLVRNLETGLADCNKLGVTSNFTGWLVDAFGHPTQSPQIHKKFGIDHVYIWRGVPKLLPFFKWSGSGRKSVFAINLFAGGYRNLYGIIKHSSSAVTRLVNELKKLDRYYLNDIPLFDGYDLDIHPEDPGKFFSEKSKLPNGIITMTSSPHDFYKATKDKVQAPEITGELLSGKFAATFSGTLSARTYLKILNNDAEKLLFRYVEPLLSLQGKSLETHTIKELLENQVHDCICGVSIDQVHDRMEYSYNKIIKEAQFNLTTNISSIGSHLKPGLYAFTPSAFRRRVVHIAKNAVYKINTKGFGIYQTQLVESVKTADGPIGKFVWKNKYYKARLKKNGLIKMGKSVLGRLVIRKEMGDTYSDEREGKNVSVTKSGSMRITTESKYHTTIEYPVSFRDNNRSVTAKIEITFDKTPLIRWRVKLNTRGTNYSLKMIFKTGVPTTHVFAGMPFDTVERKVSQDKLLPKKLSKKMEKVLLGQREVHKINSFPFHDFVGIQKSLIAHTVFAKGIRAYRAKPNGQLEILLRRSVAWLTKPDGLRDRVGDAGPKFLVPGAKCQRKITHELAYTAYPAWPHSKRFQRLNDTYQHPPAIFKVTKSNGTKDNLKIFELDSQLTCLTNSGNNLVVRTYNPRQTVMLTKNKVFRPKEIAEIVVGKVISKSKRPAKIEFIDSPDFTRVGPDNTQVTLKQLNKLKAIAKELKMQLTNIEKEMAKHGKTIPLTHTYFIIKRELQEAELSLYLNKSRDRFKDKQSPEYINHYDKKLAKLNEELNELRMYRRMYDYIAASNGS